MEGSLRRHWKGGFRDQLRQALARGHQARLPSDWVGDSNYEAWLPVSTEMRRDQGAQATGMDPEGPRAKTGAQYARVQRHRRMLWGPWRRWRMARQVALGCEGHLGCQASRTLKSMAVDWIPPGTALSRSDCAAVCGSRASGKVPQSYQLKIS